MATEMTEQTTETPVNQPSTEDQKPNETSNQTTEKPVNQSSTEVRNPDKLLELFNEQKAELKELKAFKQKQESAASQAETKRLEEKGQYESALKLKIEEATTPVNQMLEAEKKRSEKLEKTAQTWEQKYKDLEGSYKTEKLKSLVNQSFTTSGGDPDAVDLLWGAYGAKFTLSDDGKPVLSGSNQAIDEYMKTLQGDSVGSRLFLAKQAEGTGTAPQNNAGKGSTGVQAKVMTNAEANSSRDPKLMEKINSGEVIIRG